MLSSNANPTANNDFVAILSDTGEDLAAQIAAQMDHRKSQCQRLADMREKTCHEIKHRVAQLRSLGKDAATAGVARILANREERQERVVGEEEDVGALRREVTDLRQRVATLERLLGVHGTDEDGSDDDLIDEDVDGVLV